VEIKPLEEGVVSPFVFRYEDDPQERVPSPTLTVVTTDEPLLGSPQETVSSNPIAFTIIRQAQQVDLLGIGRMIFRWILILPASLISGPMYLAPLIPLLMLLVLATRTTHTTTGSHQLI